MGLSAPGWGGGSKKCSKKHNARLRRCCSTSLGLSPPPPPHPGGVISVTQSFAIRQEWKAKIKQFRWKRGEVTAGDGRK